MKKLIMIALSTMLSITIISPIVADASKKDSDKVRTALVEQGFTVKTKFTYGFNISDPKKITNDFTLYKIYENGEQVGTAKYSDMYKKGSTDYLFLFFNNTKKVTNEKIISTIKAISKISPDSTLAKNQTVEKYEQAYYGFGKIAEIKENVHQENLREINNKKAKEMKPLEDEFNKRWYNATTEEEKMRINEEKTLVLVPLYNKWEEVRNEEMKRYYNDDISNYNYMWNKQEDGKKKSGHYEYIVTQDKNRLIYLNEWKN